MVYLAHGKGREGEKVKRSEAKRNGVVIVQPRNELADNKIHLG